MEEKRFLLHELRIQNDKELQEKMNLDSKASNIATYSATFTALFFGFGSFLLEKTESNNLILASLTSLLLAGVILSIACVILSAVAFRLRNYRYVLSYENFFDAQEHTEDSNRWKEYLQVDEITAWINDFNNQQEYEDFMIKEHLVALRNNTIVNDDKASWIKNAQLFFIAGICVIPVILLLVLVGILTKIIAIK